jgi:hypothetical protein
MKGGPYPLTELDKEVTTCLPERCQGLKDQPCPESISKPGSGHRKAKSDGAKDRVKVGHELRDPRQTAHPHPLLWLPTLAKWLKPQLAQVLLGESNRIMSV